MCFSAPVLRRTHAKKKARKSTARTRRLNRQSRKTGRRNLSNKNNLNNIKRNPRRTNRRRKQSRLSNSAQSKTLINSSHKHMRRIRTTRNKAILYEGRNTRSRHTPSPKTEGIRSMAAFPTPITRPALGTDTVSM